MSSLDRDSCSIGFVSDTHDVEDPKRVVAALGRFNCQYNVHLGDIGGSLQVMAAVREFKRHLGDAQHLPPRQRRRYLDSLRQGVSPLRAYVETVIGHANLPERIAETSNAYRAVLAGMARLSHPLLIRGNVDGMQLRTPEVEASFAESHLELVSRPRLIDLGWLALVLWPSWRPADAGESDALSATTAAIATAAGSKTRVIVCAHEHLFKGPVVARYTEGVARAGLQQLSVPRFDPNPTWRCLMELCRTLPESCEICYVFGHVHDPVEVMLAGAPALRNRRGPGLRYRLHGLGRRTRHRDGPSGTARSITMLPVAVDEIGLLAVSRHTTDIGWQVVRA